MLYLLIFLSRSRLCHAFCSPWACARRSLGPLACVVASVPLMNFLDVTACETYPRDVGMLNTHHSLLPAMICLLCATFLAFFAPLYLCTLAYMFMPESVYHPYFNLMEP